MRSSLLSALGNNGQVIINIIPDIELIIGAYRDNEVSVNHPLIQMQQQLTANNIPFSNIVLSPLKEIDMIHLIADTLAADEDRVSELVHLIMAKTRSPLFLRYSLPYNSQYR